MTKGNSSSVIAVRLPDAVVARIKTIARRRRQTVNEMLKKVILGFVVGNYYAEEQVAELCELEPLAWRIAPRGIETPHQSSRNDTRSLYPDIAKSETETKSNPIPNVYKPSKKLSRAERMLLKLRRK